MTDNKVGKRELKKMGKDRRATQAPEADFTDLEDSSVFGGTMVVEAATNLGASVVEREHVDAQAADADDDGEPVVDDGHKHESQPERARHEPLDRLSKSYLAAAVDSLRRIPATALSEQFRARLLTYRHMIGKLVASGRVKGEAQIIVNLVAALAVDGSGKIDAIVFLRQVMGQVMWSASMDVARLRRPAPERDEKRDAPLGMDNMSDHSDAIAGIAGPDTNPAATLDEVDVYSSVESIHGFLSSVGDTLAENEDERLFLRLESGLSYMDERIDDPNFAGGARWEPVYSLEKAMDLQLVKNQESLVKREAQRAARRAEQLRKLGELYA